MDNKRVRYGDGYSDALEPVYPIDVAKNGSDGQRTGSGFRFHYGVRVCP